MDDGRRASSGWYQGCKGRIDVEASADWDVIERPSYSLEQIKEQRKQLRMLKGNVSSFAHTLFQ